MSDLIRYRPKSSVAFAIYQSLMSWLPKADPSERYEILAEVFKSVREQLNIQKPVAKTDAPHD